VTAERGYGKTYGLAEEAKAEREIIRAQPLSHSFIFSAKLIKKGAALSSYWELDSK
jgi:hypothetical protein